MGGRRIGAMARTGLALLDLVVVDFDVLDLDFAGADLAGIGIPELGLFWPSFNPYTVVDDRGGLQRGTEDNFVDTIDQLAPLCFVLMPFGTKTDAAGRVTNFDKVYQNIIMPAVVQAGLEPVRADEEKIGGTIHKPMFERLMLCHYAVADITGANPNVFYELGIRHAMRPRSTVIVFGEGTVLPFDIALVRGIAYKTDGLGEPVGADAVIAAIAGQLVAARGNPYDDSPIFQLIED